MDQSNALSVKSNFSTNNQTATPPNAHVDIFTHHRLSAFEWQDDDRLQFDLDYWGNTNTTHSLAWSNSPDHGGSGRIKSLNPAWVYRENTSNIFSLPPMSEISASTAITSQEFLSKSPDTYSKRSSSFSSPSHDRYHAAYNKLHQINSDYYPSQIINNNSPSNSFSNQSNKLLTTGELEIIFQHEDSLDFKPQSRSSDASIIYASMTPYLQAQSKCGSHKVDSPTTSMYDDEFIRVSTSLHDQSIFLGERDTSDDQSVSKIYTDRCILKKYWTLEKVESILRSSTNPIGKFFRDMKISAKEVIDLNLMDDLELAPMKPRTKYGQRKTLTEEEKQERIKQRNREHAKATRLRKKIFKKALEHREHLLNTARATFISTSSSM